VELDLPQRLFFGDKMTVKSKERVFIFGATIVLAVVSFLLVSFTNNFVTKADYNADKAEIVGMKRDIRYIREKVDDIDKTINTKITQ